MRLSDIGVSATELTVWGTRYVVTTGTGEHNFGGEGGGSAAFAYDAEDVEALDVASYQDFCDAMSPEDDRDLAIALATMGYRMTRAGACTPVLDDAEWALVRRTVEIAAEVQS